MNSFLVTTIVMYVPVGIKLFDLEDDGRKAGRRGTRTIHEERAKAGQLVSSAQQMTDPTFTFKDGHKWPKCLHIIYRI